MVPSQRGSKALSRTFSFTVPGRWNDLPTPIRNAGSLSIFKQQLKTHLFQHYLTSSSKKKKKKKKYIYIYIYTYIFSISSSFSLPFSPSLASLYLFEQCLTVHSHQTRRERQSGRKSLIFNESRRRAPARAAQRVLDVESIEESWNQVNFMVMSYDAVGRQPIRM